MRIAIVFRFNLISEPIDKFSATCFREVLDQTPARHMSRHVTFAKTQLKKALEIQFIRLFAHDPNTKRLALYCRI